MSTTDQTVLSEDDIALELKALHPVENLAAGPRHFPYRSLTWAGFELLLYSLCRSGAVSRPRFDNVTLSLPGGDGGRDIRLGHVGRPVGVIQCKKVDRRLPAPTVLREIVKFLLNVELDTGRLPDPAAFTYILALSRDPADTTLSFFESPKTWLAGREDQIGEYVHQLTTGPAGMRSIDPAEAAPRVYARMALMNYELFRPADLDLLLTSEAASQFRPSFFGHILAIDLEGARALIARGFADGGLASPLERLTRQDRKSLARRVSRRVADALDHTNLYKRGRTIERTAFMAKVREFLGNDRRIFPIVGLSGVGKTSAMAWLAERGAKALPPRLLVRGAEIDNSQRGIGDLLAALPWAEAGYQGGGRFAVEEMFAADLPLILLDGLNETTADPEHIRNSWIPNSLDWLSRRGAKLVVTCRPEHWAGWHDAFPHSALHLLPIDQNAMMISDADQRPARGANRNSKPPQENARPVEAGDPIRVFQLSDFTESEAIQAVAAYGLQDRLSVAQARHPFLLEVAELVDLTRTPQEFAIELVLQSFIERRVARALGRRKRMALLDEALALLSAMASEMYAARVQVLPSDTALRLARDFPDVIDCLVEEHLLLRDREGFRFQQDQVREHLQSQGVTAEDILREIRPGLVDQSRRWIDRLRAGIALVFTRPPSKSELARMREASRVVQPSVAARAAIRILEEPRAEDRVGAILNTLFEATDPARTDPDAAWAFQTIRLILGICAPSALDNELFAGWLLRLLKRPKKPWLNQWQEQIHEGIVSLLTRSENRVELKLDLLPASIVRERNFRLGIAELEGGASTEVLMRPSHPTYTHYGDRFSNSPSGQLIAHVFELDPQTIVTSLIRWLVEPDEPKRSPANEDTSSLPDAAAISLYHFRTSALDRVVAAAVGASTVAATHLLEALVITNPDEVAMESLGRVAAASEREAGRLRRAIWRAFHRSASSDREIMKFAYDGMLQSRGEDLIWALRTFFVEFEFQRRRLRQNPENESIARLAETLGQIASQNSILLHAHITHNPEEIQIAEDYSYLLQADFELGAELLENMCASDTGLSATAVAGIREYLTPSRLVEEGCRDRYARLVAILERYLDRHETAAVNRIAGFVIRTAEKAGMNRYELDEETMIELGFLDLAKRVIAHGGDNVGSLCGSMNWPIGERPRTELLAAVAESPVSDAHFEDFIFSSLCGMMHIDDGFVRLQALRIGTRRVAWDAAGLRYLRVSTTGRHKDLDVLRYWASLPSDELTEVSRKIVDWVSEGYRVRDAVIAAMHTSPMTIRSILGTPNKTSGAEEDQEA